MTVSLSVFILSVIGFCAVICAITLDIAYHKGCAKGFDVGYELGRKEADHWWMTLKADIEKAQIGGCDESIREDHN